MTNDEIMALPKLTLTYKHRAWGKGNKVVFLWINSEGDLYAYSKRVSLARPGLIFEFPTTDGNEVFTGRAKWTGKSHPDNTEVCTWQTIDRVMQQEIEAKKRLDKMRDDGPLERAILQLKMAYQSLAPTQRNQFIAWLVSKLNK